MLTSCRYQQKPQTPQEQKEQQAAEYEKKKANFITRTFWTFVMIGGFFAALFMGHVYIILIITAIQIISFKEVIAIANVPSRARDLRSTKSLNWYWLATTMYFLYGESVIYYFKHIVLVDKVLLPLATHHRFISFILYVFGQFRYTTMCSISQRRSTDFYRFPLLRRHPQGRPSPVSVQPVRMDTHGSLCHRRPGAFHHEQRF